MQGKEKRGKKRTENEEEEGEGMEYRKKGKKYRELCDRKKKKENEKWEKKITEVWGENEV